MYHRCFKMPNGYLKTLILKEPIYKKRHNFVPKREAGHSKWQNIKSTKEAMDHNRSSNFQRISRVIALAVKNGGADVSLNPKLRAAVEEASKLNMPKSSIQKAISSAVENVVDKPYWVVYVGPRGIVLGFQVVFANKNPQYINTMLASQTKKLNMKMEVHYKDLCTEKGVIMCKPSTDVENLYDKAVEDAIEAGADEVFEEEDKTIIFECLPNRIEGVCKYLTKMGYVIDSATVELDFKEHVTLSEDEKQNIETIIAKLQKQYEQIIRACYNSAG